MEQRAAAPEADLNDKHLLLRLLAADEADAAVDLIIREGLSIEPDVANALVASAASISGEHLDALWASTKPNWRRFSLELRASSGRFDEEAREEALKDPARDVRARALVLAFEHGLAVTLDDVAALDKGREVRDRFSDEVDVSGVRAALLARETEDVLRARNDLVSLRRGAVRAL